MKLSKCLGLAILVYLIVLWLLFGYFGENRLIDTLTILLLSFESLVLLGMLSCMPRRGRPLVLLFVIMVFFYFQVRTLALIADPNGLYDQFTSLAKASEMNRALVYLLLGTVFAMMGMIAGGKVGQGGRNDHLDGDQERRKNLQIPVALTSLGVLGLEFNHLYAFLSIGLSRRGEAALELSTFGKLVYTLADMDGLLILLVVGAGEQWRDLRTRDKVLASLALVGYVLTRTSMASKAGIYYIVLYWFMYRLAKSGDLRIDVRRGAVVVLPVLLVAVITFNAAREMRQHILEVRGESLELKDLYQRLMGGEAENYFDVLRPLHRLSGIDALINVVNEKGVAVSRYVSIENEMKSFGNLLLPGRPFRTPLTAQAYAVAYGAVDESAYLEGRLYTTYMWTILGLYYVLFGPVGGLVSTGLTMFVLVFLYNKCSGASTGLRVLLQFLCLYVAYWTVLSFGMDFMLFLVTHLVLSWIGYFAIFRLVRAAKSIARRAEAPAAGR